jgi:hypothetical protein
MGRFQFIIILFLPLFGFAQDYPRFELYQLVQGQDSGQFVTTGIDSNLDFNSVLRFRFQDSTLLIGADTVITDATIVPILLATIDAGLGIEVNQVNGQIFIESLSIEDSIYNGSGSIIEKGTPLYASDTQGNYWDVAPARADDPSKMPVVIIAGEEIGIGETGLGLIKGHIKQVNTTGLADGSEVYVDASGGYTSTKPTAEGVIIQRLGTVIKGDVEQGSGIINLGDEGFWNDYTSLTKLRDTLVLVRSSITTEIGDSLTNYASRTELADTANNIRLSIPIQIADSLVNYATKVELGDTALSIRNSIPIQIGDSLVNYASRTELQDTASAIRADFPAAGGDVTTAQLADTASAIRSDIPTGAITATNKGNNRIPTFDGVNNIIDGLNNYWINNFGEMVDNLSDGTSPNPVGYKFKIDSRLFADSIESNVIESASGGKANLNSLTTTGTTIFSGTIGGNNTTVLSSGQIGINETPSGNLSLTTYWGALFNDDQYNGVNGDFTVRSANKSSMFFIDSDLDAIGIGGATPNTSFDVNINGGVQINSSAAGGIYDGLIVQGDTDPVLFYVNSDRDKVGISEALPDYTLDVDGDINFNGDLYQNDALVDFNNIPFSFVMSIDLNSSNSQRIMIPSIYNGCTIDYANLVTSLTSWTGSIALDIGTVSGGAYSSSSLTSWSFTSGSGAQADENSSIGHTISTNYVVQGSYSTTSGTISKTVISFLIECN